MRRQSGWFHIASSRNAPEALGVASSRCSRRIRFHCRITRRLFIYSIGAKKPSCAPPPVANLLAGAAMLIRSSEHRRGTFQVRQQVNPREHFRRGNAPASKLDATARRGHPRDRALSAPHAAEPGENRSEVFLIIAPSSRWLGLRRTRGGSAIHICTTLP
jgi:hypothetical protein